MDKSTRCNCKLLVKELAEHLRYQYQIPNIDCCGPKLLTPQKMLTTVGVIFFGHGNFNKDFKTAYVMILWFRTTILNDLHTFDS